MPGERFPTARPNIIAGTTIVSGAPNTGQTLWTQGGTHRYTMASGTAGGDALITAQCRLDSVTIWPPATAAAGPAASGQALVFYDAAAAVSGGYGTAANQIRITPVTPLHQSSTIFNSGLGLTGFTVQIGQAFWSGLCIGSASGMLGCSVSYTPILSGGSQVFPQ